MLVHISVLQTVQEPSHYSIPFGIRQSDSTYGSNSRYQQATLSLLSILVLPSADRGTTNACCFCYMRHTNVGEVAALTRRLHLAVQAMKAYRGSRRIAPLIPKLGARLRWAFSFTVRPLYPRHPLNKWMGGRQFQFARFGEQKNLMPPPGFDQWFLGIHLLLYRQSYIAFALR